MALLVELCLKTFHNHGICKVVGKLNQNQSQVKQSCSLLPRKPILALEAPFAVHAALSPSGLQFNYKGTQEGGRLRDEPKECLRRRLGDQKQNETWSSCGSKNNIQISLSD